MIVRQFLQWMQSAPAHERADATRDLAQSYLWGELSPSDQDAVEATLVSLLDDRSTLVRKALAETLAHAHNAPASVISMLALDQSDIAEIVVKHSPVFFDSELVELARISSPPIQYALVTREDVSPSLALALAEFGTEEIAENLLELEGIEEHVAVTDKLVSRFGNRADLRHKMSETLELAAKDKHALIQNLTSDLSNFMSQTGWLNAERTTKILREATDKSILQMALALNGKPLYEYVATLLSRQEITSNLLIRSLFCGNRSFVEAVFSQISNLDISRVQGLMRDLSGNGIKALLDKANIPQSLASVFEAILEPKRGALALFSASTGSELNKFVVDATLKIYISNRFHDDATLMLLRRFASEAARDEARHFTSDLMVEAEVEQNQTIDGATIGWDVEEEVPVIAPVIEKPLSAVDMFKIEIEQKSKTIELIQRKSPLAEQNLVEHFENLKYAQNDDLLRDKELEDRVLDMIINGYKKAA